MFESLSPWIPSDDVFAFGDWDGDGWEWGYCWHVVAVGVHPTVQDLDDLENNLCLNEKAKQKLMEVKIYRGDKPL